MTVSFLLRDNAPRLAYIKREAVRPEPPIVVFLTGLASDMMGTKAQYLDQICAEMGVGYIRFDFRGHGQSGGKFEDGTIGLWRDDALDILDSLAPNKKIVLVGSSMGGWVSLLVARDRHQQIGGLIGLAAAPDFTREIQCEMNEAQRQELKKHGAFALPSGYGDSPYKISQILLDDGERQCVLDKDLNIQCPVRLIQGKKDRDVPWQTAESLMNVLITNDKKTIYLDDSDHRLSSGDDLKVLKQTVTEIAR